MSDDSFIGVISGEKDSLGRVSAWYVAHGLIRYIENPEKETEWKKIIREKTLPFSSRTAALSAADSRARKENPERGVLEL